MEDNREAPVLRVGSEAIKPQDKDNQNLAASQEIDWKSYRLRITDTIPEDDPLIQREGKTVLSRGNIMAVIGKAKSFKSFLCSGMAASIEDDCLGFHFDDSAKRVLLVDTEQGKSHVHKVQKRIYRLNEWDSEKDRDNLVVLALRQLESEDRIKAIHTAFSDVKPDLCIIDGIRDLLKDFNDVKESSTVINWLMTLSYEYNCGIIAVLHQNKADTNARGHCGTELVNKSETVLQVVNEFGIATVSAVYSRNPPIDNFSFRVFDGLPILCEPPKVVQKRNDLVKLMRQAFGDFQCLSRKELKSRLVTLLGKSEKTCSRRIDESIDADVLRLNTQGNLYLTPEEALAPFPF